MKTYGIIGFPLGHSFSPKYFSNKFIQENIEAEYKKYELLSISDLPQILKNTPSLIGFNVTIPYKSEVIKYLNYISPDAQNIGAVNCIQIFENKLWGHNTDWQAFAESIKPLLQRHMSHALILGSGGAARAVMFALNKLNIEYLQVSRSGKTNYQSLNDQMLQNFPIIINCTPLGMHPKITDYPDIPYSALTKNHLLYDLIYNPELSRFLQKGKEQNATIKNGLEMLHIQANIGWQLWQSFPQKENFIPLQ